MLNEKKKCCVTSQRKVKLARHNGAQAPLYVEGLQLPMDQDLFPWQVNLGKGQIMSWWMMEEKSNASVLTGRLLRLASATAATLPFEFQAKFLIRQMI